MPVPDYQSLMLPVLQVATKGETRVPIAAGQIADALGLSDEEREELLPSGAQRLLHNRIHWAKFYMNKAGLISSPRRGVFIATKSGRDLLASHPRSISIETLRAYPDFVEFYTLSANGRQPSINAGNQKSVESSATPEEQIENANELLNEALKAELLSQILEQSPTFFEHIIVELLVSMGYGGTHENAARGLGKSGDGGVDGVVDEDRLGLDRIYVQAKRHAPHHGIGRPEIQGFVGSLVGLGASKGVFVTTSSFSKQAYEYASAVQHRVILIDGAKLTELMIEFGVGVRVSRTVQVKRLDEDFFDA